MKTTVAVALVCLLSAASCIRPQESSSFLAGFDPAATLNRIGAAAGISYFPRSAGAASGTGAFSSTRFVRDWSFTFLGSPAQLSDQLDRVRAEVERQIKGRGAEVSERGQWSGDFSGFSFGYSAGARMGFVRVTGVSFAPDKQGLEFVVFER